MKELMVTALALVGAYAAIQWFRKSRRSPAAQNAQNFRGNSGFIAGVTGQGDLYTDPLTSGIPAFNPTPVINRPDQIAAALHTNSLATIPGGGSYIPAFGPDENRGGLDVF